MSGPKPLVLLAAGGTGGHLFPAEALADVLQVRGIRVDLATDNRAAAYAASFPAEKIHLIPSDTVRGGNPFRFVWTLFLLATGILKAFFVMLWLRPAAVVGFGGYPTFPPIFAAWLTGVPRIVHEQNAVMGRANRALASRATAIATGYPNIFDALPDLAKKATHTGNPVRAAVRAAAAVPYEAPQANGAIHLLVFGGSQGARIMSEIVPGAIELCAPALRSRFRVVQQCREADVAEVKAVYARLGLPAEIATFFSDLPARMARSQLVIARSGASTVAELAALGRPAILVPLPHALDNDQLANATALAAAGGAMLVRQAEFTAERLAQELTQLLTEPDTLPSMAVAARRTGNADAAEKLADLVLRVAKISPSPLVGEG